jgi:hypothetical protein
MITDHVPADRMTTMMSLLKRTKKRRRTTHHTAKVVGSQVLQVAPP